LELPTTSCPQCPQEVQAAQSKTDTTALKKIAAEPLPVKRGSSIQLLVGLEETDRLAKVQLLDPMGTLLLEQEVHPINPFIHNIALAQGVYYLKIYTSKQCLVQKVTIFDTE
jgi:hypothetical protein